MIYRSHRALAPALAISLRLFGEREAARALPLLLARLRVATWLGSEWVS